MAATLLALAASACGPTLEAGPRSAATGFDATHSALSTCPWDPVFGIESCYQSEWWLEYSVRDTTVTAMQVEISGTTPPQVVLLPTRIDLGGGSVKFTGGPNDGIAAGTPIRVVVTRPTASGTQAATSGWFPYLQATPSVECAAACTPTCAPGACGTPDGCGGTCGPCAAGNTCVNGTCVCVPACGSNTCGSDGCGGSCGTCASGSTCVAGKCACTPTCAPGACGTPDGCGGTCGPCATGLSCVAGKCACVPSCGSNQCGSDGCGGSCGSCGAGLACVSGTCVPGCVAPWNPIWQQTSGAGEWWAEFSIEGGGALTSAVSVEMVETGALSPLSFAFGRWMGGVVNLLQGSQIILHATNALGATAQTAPFRYKIDTVPPTDQCRGTPQTSTTCKPLLRGLVTFTLDDSADSQATVAVPLLQKYGVKGTFYTVPPWLTWTSLAKSLAADGHEFAAHTMTHPDLPSLSPPQLDDELRLAKQWLEANIASPVVSFASPSGAYNDAVVNAIKPYYASHRTTVDGLNFQGSDRYRLNTQFVTNTSTVAGVCAQISDAAAKKGWLVLTFHDFTAAATATDGFTCPAAVLEGILACATSTPGLDVVTTRQAVAAITCGSP